MKRIGAILALSLVIILACAPLALAANFGVDEGASSPKNGATGQSIDNMGFKVYFTDEVYSTKNQKSNAQKCQILDNKGNEIPIRVAFSKSEKNMVLVLADINKKNKDNKTTTIRSLTKYTLVIDKGFKSTAGQEMDEYRTSFETLNSKSSMRASMGMMGVMVVGMIFFTSKEAKRKAKEENQSKAPTVNPYKVAKKTGKSVEDIVAKDQKKKEKSASALARKERHKRENKVEISSNNMRVSAPRPISEAGSTYKRPKVDTQGKKNTNPKNQSGKQKNKNNKKK